MLIVDGSHLLHRVLHVPGISDLRDSQNRPTGGIHGFIMNLQSTARKYKCSEGFIVAWDQGVPQFRRQVDPGYKGWKPDSKGIITTPSLEAMKVDDEVFLEKYHFTRRTLHEEILPALGCISVRVTDCEADDIIAKVVESYRGQHKTIITSDKDLYQLIDRETSHYDPIKDEEKNISDLIQEYELDPDNYRSHYILIKALLGDGSDGIPGIPGIAWTRALEISKQIMSGGINSVPNNKVYQKNFHNNIDRLKKNILLTSIFHHINVGNKQLGEEILRQIKLASLYRIDPDYAKEKFKSMGMIKAISYMDYIIEANENDYLFDVLSKVNT